MPEPHAGPGAGQGEDVGLENVGVPMRTTLTALFASRRPGCTMAFSMHSSAWPKRQTRSQGRHLPAVGPRIPRADRSASTRGLDGDLYGTAGLPQSGPVPSPVCRRMRSA